VKNEKNTEGGCLQWSDEQLTALDGSIEKWRNIVEGTGTDLADDNCPLCHLYCGRSRKAPD